MTVRLALLSTLCAAVLAGPASAAGDQGPHRSLVIGGDCVDCTFEGANLAGAQFLGGDFRNTNFEDAILLGARLVDLNLQSANFQSASLIEAHFANSGLEAANLQNAQLDRSRFHQVRMTGANLSDATMDEAVLFLTDLTGADLRDLSANSSVFRQVTLDGARARGGQFESAHFNRSALTGADLRNANFQGAIIENVDFTGADLRGADFDDARLMRVNITGADVRDVTGLTAESLAHVCGSQVRGLADSIELPDCSDMTSSLYRTQASALAMSAENRRIEHEARRAQIAIAQSAFEDAIGQIELHIGDQQSRLRLEALAAASEGWEAAAEALAEAQVELAGSEAQVEWSFEIRRAELGEPIRVILEQAAPDRVLVIRPNTPTPPPPPSPPAPDLPRRAQTELLGGAEASTTARAVFIERRNSAVRISAADISFLVEATANDFAARNGEAALDFRGVQAGRMAVADGPDHALLCGEVELDGDGSGTAWQPFATVRSSGFEILVGDAGAAVCSDDRLELQASADLAIRIERRLAEMNR